MELLLLIAFAVLIGTGIGFGIARERYARGSSDTTEVGKEAPGGWQEDLRQLVDELKPVYDVADHPARFADNQAFTRAARLVAARAANADEVLRLLTDNNPLVGCIAGQAIGSRSDIESIGDGLLAKLFAVDPWPLFFAMPQLAAVNKPTTGDLFLRAPAWWQDYPGQLDTLRRFVDCRVERGEQISFAGGLVDLETERAEEIEALIRIVDRPELAALTKDLNNWRANRTDRTFLGTVGKLWGRNEFETLLLATPALDTARDAILELLQRESPRSVLLVGDAGVGKTSRVRAVGRAMAAAGWTVVEADATSLLADQVYIGSLQGRIRELLENLALRRRVLWYAPGFHELLLAGRHRENPVTGVLDMVLPAIERGSIVLIGEIRAPAFERLLAARPHLASALEIVRVEPADEATALELGEAWAIARGDEGGQRLASGALLGEALQLANHLLGEFAAPGNLLTLLELTGQQRRSRNLLPPIELDDVLDTLSTLSGLPRSVLDDRQRLDLAAIRSQFENAVIGQTEAIDCLVDRIAMIKAGLTDPGRPLGVFLLAGPTGTGKTELAKTLARYLFGSAERMVRLDMSELQSPESLDRLLGDTKELAGPASLAGAVRRQPFSIVLLDEFEKAHYNVWDIFLQVFDDGRLTDRLGNTADFRHTIILLTSNLGASIGGSVIGFVGAGRGFSPSLVRRAVANTFRPEFLNRLDRVIVFEPLSRLVMREILRKELAAMLERRGLRMREWAVEWEESVVEFLLEKGFTAELGARPLRRAIERFVLGPLSATIVEHRFPDGDQFLFLRSDGKAVQAEFVDPDAPDVPEEEAAAVSETSGLRLGEVALAARGTPDELALLESIYASLRVKIDSEPWSERKQRALEATRDPEFWDREGRAEVLDSIELMDRMEAALGSAGSLARRLRGDAPGARVRYPASMVRRLANQIHLVDAACRAFDADQPQDAVVAVEAFADPHLPHGANETFARRIADMYRRWADHRRMRLTELDPHGLGEPGVAAFAVNGLGAYILLAPEAGLHVLEEPDERHGTRRTRARVRVVPAPNDSSARDRSSEDLVKRAFARDLDPTPAIVRHYRDTPSPLVRDRVRGWRTGHLDRVLGGDFDLFH